MKVAIRADAGPIQGSGHVMRCRTLAEKLLSLGSTVTFYSNIQGIPWLHDSLEAMDIEVISVEKNTLAIAELAGKNFDFIVVDSYEIPVDKINELAEKVPVLAIVDEPNPRLRVHAVLDQNLGAEMQHIDPYSDGTLTLLGSKFALVRDEFLKIRINAPERIERIEDSRLLCFFGGSDPSSAAIKIASVFNGRERPHITILAPRKDHADLTSVLGVKDLYLSDFTNNLSGLISECDTVICAAGTSAWDLLTIGIPTAFVSVAGNQKNNFNSIVSRNVGVGISLTDSQASNYEKISNLVLLNSLREQFFHNSREFFDGNGAKNVVETLNEEITNY